MANSGNVLSIDNIKKHFVEFDNTIHNIVRDAEKSVWVEVPSQDTNNAEQIINFAIDRLEVLDALMLNYL